MKSTIVVLFVLVALAISGSIHAQAQTPYIESFDVRLHNLDVVVTDKKGNPIRGLGKNDFIVLENGVAQAVTNFSPYETGLTKAASENPATPPSEGEPVAPPPRRFVFFIDQIEMQKVARDRVFRDVQKFVEAMREGDLATVIRPTAKDKVLQPFTTDRAAVERAIKQAIDENGFGFRGLTYDLQQLQVKLNRLETRTVPAETDTIRREYAFAVRRRVEHRLGQLRALTSSLAQQEGRKILVMVTAGLAVKPGSEAIPLEQEMGIPAEPGFASADDMEGEPSASEDGMRAERVEVITRDHSRQIEDIARTAAANGVTIYAVEPELRLNLAARGAASVRVAPGPRSAGQQFGPDRRRDLLATMQSDILQNSAVTLDTLTEKTGGKWFRGLGGMDNTLRQINEDLSVYYSLAYRATGEDGKPRRVEVKVRNRPELRVRTRTDVVEKSTEREMDDLVIASLIYPQQVNELGIDVTAGQAKPARGYAMIPLDVLIPLDKLTFLPNGEKYVASFNVHFAAAGQERDFMSGGKQAQLIELTPAQFEQRAATKYRYKTGINVSHGMTKIAVGVLDSATKLTGFDTISVEVR